MYQKYQILSGKLMEYFGEKKEKEIKNNQY